MSNKYNANNQLRSIFLEKNENYNANEIIKSIFSKKYKLENYEKLNLFVKFLYKKFKIQKIRLEIIKKLQNLKNLKKNNNPNQKLNFNKQKKMLKSLLTGKALEAKNNNNKEAKNKEINNLKKELFKLEKSLVNLKELDEITNYNQANQIELTQNFITKEIGIKDLLDTLIQLHNSIYKNFTSIRKKLTSIALNKINSTIVPYFSEIFIKDYIYIPLFITTIFRLYINSSYVELQYKHELMVLNGILIKNIKEFIKIIKSESFKDFIDNIDEDLYSKIIMLIDEVEANFNKNTTKSTKSKNTSINLNKIKNLLRERFNEHNPLPGQ